MREITSEPGGSLIHKEVKILWRRRKSSKSVMVRIIMDRQPARWPKQPVSRGRRPQSRQERKLQNRQRRPERKPPPILQLRWFRPVSKAVRLSPRLQPVQPLAVHGEPFCLHSGRSATPCLKYLSFYACCYCFSL